jgi:transcriptional regulator with XRE-family HTH domain
VTRSGIGTLRGVALVSAMVARIRSKGARRRLFLKEHREAKGLSAEQMAGRLGITRESLYRQEREPWRVNSEKQAQWADALDIAPEALWRLPGGISLDELVRNQPTDIQEMAADIVRRLVNQK